MPAVDAGPVGMGDEVAGAEEEHGEVDGDHDPAVDREDALFLDIFHVDLL
ncbi:MAG: hypothetical protein M0C28_20315 [Candidatus Moduliflexus flocculans]|nr:hypothetical protein [Candidatus Moduliflexus flocculans]